MSEFSGFSAGVAPQLSQQPVLGADGMPGQALAVEDAQVMDRAEFDRMFNGRMGDDATSQALAVPDDPLTAMDAQLAQQVDENGQPLQAHLVNEAEIRAWLDEYHAWKNADDLSQPLMEKFVSATVDGQSYRIPVSEAVRGYQRASDYSNKLRELYAFRDELQRREAGLQKLLMDMDKGQSFLDAMVFLGKFKGFSEAAIIYGTQLDAERRMTPEQRAVHIELRRQRAAMQQLEIENRNLRGAQQAQQAQQQPQGNGPNHDQVRQIYMQQLSLLAPKIADRLGFVATPYARGEFERHFENMLPSIQGQDLTSEFVERVIRATMESVDAQLQRSGFVLPQPQVSQNGQAGQQAHHSQGQYRAPAGQPQGGQWAARSGNGQQNRQLPPVSQLPGPSQPRQQRQERMRIGDFGRAIQGKPV